MRTCYIYSEQELSPRAADVISQIKRENGYEDVKFVPATIGSPTSKILVFGSKPPEGMWQGVEFVHTYSIAQIMAKANAVTVLIASLQMYFNGKHEVPEHIVPRSVLTPRFAAMLKWDYDAPTAIDIETTGNLGKTHTPEEVNLLSVAFYQEGREPIVILGARSSSMPENPFSPGQLEDLALMLPLFSKAIYHNGKFDTRVLNRILGVRLCVWFDTMLAHHVLNMAAGDHKLKSLAQRYLGAPEWEFGLSRYTKAGGHYELIPRDVLTEYNGWDVYWTYQLWKLFAPQIESDDNNQKAFMLEMSAADMLLDVEMAGIPFSFYHANELSEKQATRMLLAKSELQKITRIETFNPNSPKQVKDYLWSIRCMVQNTGKEVIEELAKTTDDEQVATFCETLIRYRQASKIKGTYADGWAKHSRHARVHPTFLVHGTSTGRLSSTGPNAQNVPRNKEVRKMVTLTEEHEPGVN